MNKGLQMRICNPLIFLVGARGFEPPTTCTPCRYATRLRYAPTCCARKSILSGAQAVQQFPEFALEGGDVGAGAGNRRRGGRGGRTCGTAVMPVVAGGGIVEAV